MYSLQFRVSSFTFLYDFHMIMYYMSHKPSAFFHFYINIILLINVYIDFPQINN
jgi:hypothetical protein